MGLGRRLPGTALSAGSARRSKCVTAPARGSIGANNGPLPGGDAVEAPRHAEKSPGAYGREAGYSARRANNAAVSSSSAPP